MGPPDVNSVGQREPVISPVNILFVGDVVGGIGKRTLFALLPELRETHAVDFVVVNGENAAGGVGITPKVADELFGAGVDAITLGNHTYRHREIYGYLDEEPRIVRPANFLRSQPGHGWCIVEHHGVKLGVLSLREPVYARRAARFAEVDAARTSCGTEVDQLLVDIHAEATSEKVGMGWYLDGRVTAVVGTHTHVPTADARVLPGGTAYITRRRHDRPARRRDRRQARAGDRGAGHPDAGQVRDLDGGPVAERRPDPIGEPMRADAIEQLLLPAPGSKRGYAATATAVGLGGMLVARQACSSAVG